jgi:hypothetical protein
MKTRCRAGVTRLLLFLFWKEGSRLDARCKIAVDEDVKLGP